MALKKTTKTVKPKKEEANAAELPVLEAKFVGESTASYTPGAGGTRTGRVLETKNRDYHNIENFASPFSFENGYLDTRRAVHLCVQAYWAFPLLRNVIEVMVELANSRLYLKGGNKRTRDFIGQWMEMVGMHSLKEQFFREWFRSGNFFVYRYDGSYKTDDLLKTGQVWGEEMSANLRKVKLPIRYLILNPETIRAGGNINFVQPYFFKILNPYEIQRLRHPETPEDVQVLKDMDPETRELVKNGSTVNLRLDPNRLNIMLYKAQSYEPMGVPMAYGLLDDIEMKLEMKRLDLAAARMMERALLLINVGETPTDQNPMGLNPATLTSLQSIFGQESITRTLVADWTVKGEWLIPDTSKILGPERYEQIDKDINIGLNAILFDSSEKFANTSIKVQVFIERLKEARANFIEKFLQPEIKKICRAINAKTFPEVFFEEISLKDELQYAKLTAQLYSLGLMTPDEVFKNFDTGEFPTTEDSLDHQKVFKEQRDQGYYMPLVGGSTALQEKQLESNENIALQKAAPQGGSSVKQSAPKSSGRPSGTGTPKSSHTPKAKASENAPLVGFSLSKLRDVSREVSKLQDKVDATLLKRHGISELNEAQKSISKILVANIVACEPSEEWGMKKINEYLSIPKETPESVASELDEIGIRHGVDNYTAAILRLCKTNE